DIVVINTWFFTFEEHMKYINVPQAHWVQAAVVTLRKDAAIWWQVCKTRHVRGLVSIIRTWEEFQIALRDEFAPKQTERDLRDRLHFLTQTTTVREYIKEFRALLMQLPDEFSQKDLVDRFVRGLVMKIANEVLLRSPETLAEAENYALLIEETRGHSRYNLAASLQGKPSGKNGKKSSSSTYDAYLEGWDPMDIDALRVHLNALHFKKGQNDETKPPGK